MLQAIVDEAIQARRKVAAALIKLSVHNIVYISCCFRMDAGHFERVEPTLRLGLGFGS